MNFDFQNFSRIKFGFAQNFSYSVRKMFTLHNLKNETKNCQKNFMNYSDLSYMYVR